MTPPAGPCLCGDTQCPSCGRAQGTYDERCVCGETENQHSEHIDDLTGELLTLECQHNEERCAERARQEAQAEAEAEARLEEQLALQHEDLHGPDCRCY